MTYKNAKQQRAKVLELRSDLRHAEEHLARLERQCSHDWDAPKYDPIVIEAHTAPGHMHIGSKWIDVEVPRQETPRWTRECRNCGKTEQTSQVTEQVSRTPRFGP
jgi:hypothetical protein